MGSRYDLLVTAVSSGFLVWILQSLGRVVAAMRRARLDRENAVESAERVAAEWQVVAIRTRVLAVEAGVDPRDLPSGPGEHPAWKEE